MPRKNKEEKRIETAVEAAFKEHGRDRQFKVMDLTKIFAAGTAAGVKGEDIGAAVKAACDRYEMKTA